MQPDLFTPALLPGLDVQAALITEAEEAALIPALDALGLAPFRFHGWLGNRQTASFGWHYDFDTAQFAPARPMPDVLMPLRARAATFAGLAEADLAQALVTRYDPGAGIGWHRDRPVFDHVVGISLGAPAVMRFRRRAARGFERSTLPLDPRAAYRLSDEARHLWEHSIAPMTAPRWSVTFRSLAKAAG
ncbi:alpha-ketoglutarate-dependent dioxygenase AlkB [Polymorphobacter sp.]|uniref:alpha-ketoglutarate-dependent dioxygenase AlkB n=1 Tax=Polymorphobacter sp. TaxID=1909290 RepID=UPI003F726A7C